jgi:DNA-binding NtrC family response regulator
MAADGQEALARLQAHAWPGNVRELANVIERAVVLCAGDRIGPDDLALPGTGLPTTLPIASHTGNGDFHFHMKLTVGTTRLVIVATFLMGGAFGMLGDMKQIATNHAVPRVPRTQQEETAHVEKSAPSTMTARGVSVVARGHSGETDPCIPIAPVTFSTRGPVIC